MVAMKINVTKTHVHCYGNVDMVRGCSYKKFTTRKFIIHKFHSTEIFRSMVLAACLSRILSCLLLKMLMSVLKLVAMTVRKALNV